MKKPKTKQWFEQDAKDVGSAVRGHGDTEVEGGGLILCNSLVSIEKPGRRRPNSKHKVRLKSMGTFANMDDNSWKLPYGVPARFLQDMRKPRSQGRDENRLTFCGSVPMFP